MFDPHKLYSTRDPELGDLLPYSTLAQWRHEGRGPAYFKVAGRVLYSGKDLNDWLASQRVEPANEPAAPVDSEVEARGRAALAAGMEAAFVGIDDVEARRRR